MTRPVLQGKVLATTGGYMRTNQSQMIHHAASEMASESYTLLGDKESYFNLKGLKLVP